MNWSPAAKARCIIILAAILWSTSGGLIKLLTKPNPWGFSEPSLCAPVIGFYRSLAGAIFMLFFLRPGMMRFHSRMLWMMVAFAVMSYSFIEAMAHGGAAETILLQYTAPAWVVLFDWLARTGMTSRRDIFALTLSTLGILCIVVGKGTEDPYSVSLALTSGVTYALVVVCLNHLRSFGPFWLTYLNLTSTCVILLPMIIGKTQPNMSQLMLLSIFGCCQMAVPYLCMSYGVRHVSPTEAALLTLLEPVLNPLWAYIVSGEVPAIATWWGGAAILGALVTRYIPWKSRARSVNEASNDASPNRASHAH